MSSIIFSNSDIGVERITTIHIRADESEDISLQEKFIHEAIEKDLEKLETGLIFIDHKPRIGTGEIDTLAVDAENRPVFIEYKAPGGFDKEALIQVMDYLSFFLRDETHFTMLRDFINRKRGDIGKIETEIRLICVVNRVEERVKNACFSIVAPISIFSYSLYKEAADAYNVVLRKEIDTDEEKAIPTEYLGKSEILDKFALLKPIYLEVEKYIKSLGTDIHENPLGDHTVNFRRHTNFLAVRFRKRKGLMLDMDSGEDVQNVRFKHWSSYPSWGYVHLNSLEDFNEEVKNWIKKAYENNTL